MERWLPVVGYEDCYEVSDQGRVRSVTRQVRCKGNHLRTLRGQGLRLGVDKDGYPKIVLSRERATRTFRVSRLMLLAFIGPPPEGMVACHNNGNCADNRLENLRWDTYSENTLDNVRLGTHINARKTHCPRNHPLTPVEWATSTVRRTCRVCARERANRAA